MKTMTCKQLGGPCETEFHANSFEEMTALSKKHGMEMYEAGDQKHLAAMTEMRKIMETPEQMTQWLTSKRKEFNALPEDE